MRISAIEPRSTSESRMETVPPDVDRGPNKRWAKLARSFVRRGDAPVPAHQYPEKQCTQARRTPRTTQRLFAAWATRFYLRRMDRDLSLTKWCSVAGEFELIAPPINFGGDHLTEAVSSMRRRQRQARSTASWGHSEASAPCRSVTLGTRTSFRPILRGTTSGRHIYNPCRSHQPAASDS